MQRIVTQSHGLRNESRLGRFFRNRYVVAFAWLIVVATFVSGIVGGYHRGIHNQPDWRSWVSESQYVWHHGSIPAGTSMFGYLPAAFFALWPFTQWLPPSVGLVAFIAVNAFAGIASCYMLYRWWFLPACPGASTTGYHKASFVWPLFLFIAHIQHVLQANQFTLWVLLLCVTGLTLLMHKREWLGGLVLGLGVCIKVTPAVFLVYLALRRQWKALAAMVIAIVVFDVATSVLFFGLDGAVQEHRMWLRRADWYSNRRFIEDPYLRVRRHGHNCSWSIVLARWLRPPPDADYQVILHGDPPVEVVEQTRSALRDDAYLVLDPMPTAGMTWSKTRDEIPDLPRFRFAHLSAEVVWWIWAVTLAIPIGLLLAATHRRRRGQPGSAGWSAEAALWMLLMLWPTPMMRDYYLALALPAFVVVWRMVLMAGTSGRERRSRLVGIAAIAFFYLSVVCLSWQTGTFYGLHLATVAGLVVACIRAWRIGEGAAVGSRWVEKPVASATG